MINNIVIVGASGAIGSSFTLQLSVSYPNATIHAFSQQQPEIMLPNVTYHQINYRDETSIEESALIASKDAKLDMVIVATGILHDGALLPEKSLKELSAEKFHLLFEANTILPSLIAKHFLPKLNRDSQSIFAALSAAGTIRNEFADSISENAVHGSDSQENAAIEIGRSNKKTIIVGLHPGTVDSNLSMPFQGNVPDGKLFTPEYSVQKLLQVLTNLTSEQSGKCFAWDGTEVKP